MKTGALIVLLDLRCDNVMMMVMMMMTTKTIDGRQVLDASHMPVTEYLMGLALVHPPSDPTL